MVLLHSKPSVPQEETRRKNEVRLSPAKLIKSTITPVDADILLPMFLSFTALVVVLLYGDFLTADINYTIDRLP